MENVEFSQQLNDTFQQQDVNFDMRSRLRNSKRGKSKAIARANQRVKRALRNVQKARTNLKRVKARLR